MNTSWYRSPFSSPSFWSCAVLALAALVAAVSARPFVGWNDGSRLATVESLVDHHTLSIDDSVFVRVPEGKTSRIPSPYPANDPGFEKGTGDKLFVGGHYYSDKSPVPAILMAGVYQVVHSFTGLTAAERPDLFCFFMTLFSSGLVYVASVACVYRMGQPLGLSSGVRLALTASFGIATVALPYARHVNNHIFFLGVTAGLMLQMAWMVREEFQIRWSRLLTIGSLAGLGYTIDLGAGPVLLVCVVMLVGYRFRSPGPVAIVVASALPWLLAHHVLNYAIGGTFKPANANPEYFEWPGCSFNPQNMTGALNHSVGHFLTYAAALLAGKRGFLGHNLPLLLTIPALVFFLKKRPAEFPELTFAVLWCGGTWMAYALTSNNYSGQCCSVRWFVPFLAPGYYVLAVFLRDYPAFREDFMVLSGWGAVMGALMWWKGPWMGHMVPFYWPIVGAALASWLALRIWVRGKAAKVTLDTSTRERPAQAA